MKYLRIWPDVSWVMIALLVGSGQLMFSFPVRTVLNVVLGAASVSATDSSGKTIPSTSTSPPVGWKTFVSTNLQVAVDYPKDWSVSEDKRQVTFRSEEVGVIRLAVTETGQLSPENFLNETVLPNTRCSSRINRAGITARICFDTLSGSYSADFVLKSRLLSLSMPQRGDLKVFNGMVESLRPLE